MAESRISGYETWREAVLPDTDDTVSAFMPGPRCARPPMAEGLLSGLAFGLKDLFDVAGDITGFGNPDWASTHPPAVGTAPAVAALLEAGGRLVGKTKTVELAYGLTGENVWYGTPINPAAPNRFPGGSSCGSASATAGRLVDFALGSDTGGSVRIPASYCGLFGIRPTHGAISLAGACPLAPSLDTLGWFARDAATLARIGDVLLPESSLAATGPLLVVAEAWDNARAETASALWPAVRRLESLFGPAIQIHPLPETLDTIFAHFRAVQAEEAWTALGSWIEQHAPNFGPGVKERFAAAKALDPSLASSGRAFRSAFRARMQGLLAGGAIMVYPTSPGPAPLLDLDLAEQDAIRRATMGVTAIAGFAGLPELTLPVATVDGAPVGLSLTAGSGRDRALLAQTIQAARLLNLPC